MTAAKNTSQQHPAGLQRQLEKLSGRDTDEIEWNAPPLTLEVPGLSIPHHPSDLWELRIQIEPTAICPSNNLFSIILPMCPWLAQERQ